MQEAGGAGEMCQAPEHVGSTLMSSYVLFSLSCSARSSQRRRAADSYRFLSTRFVVARSQAAVSTQGLTGSTLLPDSNR
jgi:hypothetical protein